MKDIDWTKPVRGLYGGSTYRVLCTDAPGYYSVILLAASGLPVAVTITGRSMVHGPVAFENIPEAVAPVEIQEAFEEGYGVGCNHPFGNDISKATAAWHNSDSKQINIGKRVV